MGSLADWFPEITLRRRKQLWYGPLLGIAMAFALVRLLVYASFLSVDAFGVFSAGILVSSSFCMLGCFGLMPMLQREWPISVVHGQRRRGWVRAVQCCGVAAAVGAFLVLASAAGWSVAGLESATLMFAIVHGVAQQVFLVLTTGSRSAGNALQYARQQFLRNAAMLTGGLLLVRNGGNAMQLIAFEAGVTFAAALVIATQSARFEGLRVGFITRLAWHRLGRISWAKATTLMSVMLLSFAMINIDRWLASFLLDGSLFGLYSFAAIVLAAAQAGQALINAAGYPLIARRFATQGPASAFAVSMKLSAYVAASGTVLVIPLVWAGPPAIERWYPQYAAAAPLLPWLAAIGLLRAADFWSTFLIIGGHEAAVLRLNVSGAAVAVVAWSAWVLSESGAGAEPVAFAVLAGLVTACGAAGTFVVARRIGRRDRSDTAPRRFGRG